MIPGYVLRRNTFGFDINKRGTHQGEVKGLSRWVLLLPRPLLIFQCVLYFFPSSFCFSSYLNNFTESCTQLKSTKEEKFMAMNSVKSTGNSLWA
ncbi:unnamed protein product [Brassica oleracea var. botrytis]